MTQLSMFVKQERSAKQLPPLDLATIGAYLKAVEDNELFTAGAMKQVLTRLGFAEAYLHQICDDHEKKTSHTTTSRQRMFIGVRTFLGRIK